VAHLQRKPLNDQLKGLIYLTRWREYVPFVVPLTILGALLAARPHGILLDWRLGTVIAANILAVAYAFMINDIEDAPEDALVPERARRNPITMGMVNIRTGYTACRIVGSATLILFALAGTRVFIIGMVIMLLSHMYSWRPVRLKARPVTDIVAHSLMLSGLLLLAGYFIYHHDPGVVWFVAVGATLFSVYGQLYNQLQDFDTNKHAGLQNTAIYLGEVATRRIMHLSAIVSLLCLLVAIFRDVFPVAFLVAILIGFVGAGLMKTTIDDDMPLLESMEAQANNRIRGLLVVNMIVAAWLIYSVGDQVKILQDLGFDF
jgi:4-hydroxybenzoate polyprenyltransferase